MTKQPHIRTKPNVKYNTENNKKENFYIKIIDKLNSRFSRTTSILIVVSATIIIVLGLIFGIMCAVDAYNKEMERLHQIQLEEEERQRLEEEERARQEAEAERLRQEQAAKEKLQKEYNAVMNLAQLGLASKNLSITPFMQYPEYPSGCEPMALTNMLKYYGFNLAKNTIISNYLVYHSSNFVDFYSGNPKSVGVEMSPGICAVSSSFLSQNGSTLRTYNVSGREFESLFAYVERGHPVVIWTSLNMSSLGPSYMSYRGYNAYTNSHTVVLTGFDRASGTVYICDSINGNVSYPISRVKSIYNKQSMQAVVLISQAELDLWIQGIDASYDDTIPPYVPPEEDSEEDSEDQSWDD